MDIYSRVYSPFLLFCDPEDYDDHSSIKMSPQLLTGNEEFIAKTCDKIRDYSITLLNEIEKIDILTTTRVIHGGKDVTYKALRPVCRNDTRCKKIYRFMEGQKTFIPQITHIVQEFGLFLPQKVNSLQYVPDVEERVNKILKSKRSPTGHIGKKITGGQDGKIFGMTLSEFREAKAEFTTTHTNFVEPLDFSILSHISLFTNKDYSEKFQKWIYDIHDRICTVLRLRYIDLYVCNDVSVNMTPTNKKHAETYEVFLQLKNTFSQNIISMNKKRRVRRRILYKSEFDIDFSRDVYL